MRCNDGDISGPQSHRRVKGPRVGDSSAVTRRLLGSQTFPGEAWEVWLPPGESPAMETGEREHTGSQGAQAHMQARRDLGEKGGHLEGGSEGIGVVEPEPGTTEARSRQRSWGNRHLTLP